MQNNALGQRRPRLFAQAMKERESGQTIVLILIALAIIGGGWWFLNSSRASNEKSAWAFANDAATRIVLQQETRFLDRALSPSAQVLYPPSWRERLIAMIRETGTPQSDMRLRGHVEFVSGFFDPSGEFIAEWKFPNGPASIDLKISHPHQSWQIDGINWTWQPPPPPTPTPTATPEPTAPPEPTATPSPAPRRR